MIAHRVRGRSTGTVDSADVTGDGIAKRSQEFAEGTVQMEAVAAPTLPRDARRRITDIEAPGFSQVDPHGLARDPFDMATVPRP